MNNKQFDKFKFKLLFQEYDGDKKVFNSNVKDYFKIGKGC